MEAAGSVQVDLEIDRTVGYASIQNAVPVLRSLRIANRGDTELRGVEVALRCNPPFARGATLRFERLGPGESRQLAPVDLQPDHAWLSTLPESVRAAIEVTVQAGGREAAAPASHPIEVLAYDQWAGTRSLPELLAAFSMPNNPAVDLLVGQASRLLRQGEPGLSMDGYQSRSREVVWKQVSALYGTIAAANLQYAEPPASFGNDGQKIRTPERILEGRVATCLDLAMLFSSCLEQAGLRPVILARQGHAWVGVWLHPASLPYALTEDAQAVRKRVDTGEFLVFETTGVAGAPGRRPSLRLAVEQGSRHLQEEESFLFAVDVHMARAAQIKPLPSRGAGLPGTGAAADPAPPAQGIEPPPVLPPFDPADPGALELAAEDSPEGRLAKWKGKLLDLTLRNRLLNFKPVKASLQLVAPDLAALEDSLAAGQEFRIRPLPALMEGADPRSAQVHASRGSGRPPLDDMALQCLAGQELIGRVQPEGLDASLLALFGAARTGQEEGGANTLYLALGMLKWREEERAEAVHAAPILLVPVSLTRQSVKSGFRLVRHDDETIVNPTLLQLLRSAFAMNIPGLDALPADEKGVDVVRILQAFRLAVRDVAGWEVQDQAWLGIFSFTKYLMWKDLQDRTEALKANRVVRHLIEHPGEAFATEPRDAAEPPLDEAYRPQDILAPLLSDSSQLRAICAVDSGRDLVLEGPPGTGKSQTITNLIAHAMAKGRSVLFVSEKMAALEVVHRRLSQIGLAPFCLELHSSKARKAEVLQQLGAALAVPDSRGAGAWEQEAQRLAGLRQALNALVEGLHREHRNGLTVYDAIGLCIVQAQRTPSPMPWAEADVHAAAELDTLRETARRIAALGQALPALGGHPLRAIGHVDWSPSWQDALLAATDRTLQAAATLKERLEPIARLLQIPADGLGLAACAALDPLCDYLLRAPEVPAGLARGAGEGAVRARLQALVGHGKARQAHWAALGEGWSPQLAKFDGLQLAGEWSQAVNAWWPKSWFARRSLRAKLAAVRTDGKPPSEEQLARALQALPALNDEDAALRGLEADARALLEDSFAGVQTDWPAVERHQAWAAGHGQALANFSQALGLDVQQSAALAARVAALAGEQRALLQAGALVGTSLLAYRGAHADLVASLAALEQLAHPAEPLAGPAGAPGALERLRATLESWKAARRDLQPWCVWRKTREGALAQGLQGLVASVEAGAVALPEVPAHFEFSYQHWWLRKVFDADPLFREFSSADHERKIREFREADARFQQLTQDYIVASIAARLPAADAATAGADSELGRLRRELQKQRRHLPVRQLVQGLPTLLPRLKPCLLMSPLSVAQYLDARHAQFDLVVFDEASQIPVWDAVGVIARGRQLVVVGDPKQLPPTSFFAKASEDGEGGEAEGQVEDLESILDECLAAGIQRLTLRWHYRSRHESLITFSNVRYYGSRLVTFPSPQTRDAAVRFQPVAGVYDRGGSRTNRAEAEAVVDAIEAHFAPAGERPSVGVVTFNQTQQVLIETLLDARRRQNPGLDRALAQLRHEPLFIKNLENVQGDERDLILFSITYGPDAAGRVSMNFGPLNGEGGHRRLNVAISRARQAVRIFSTLRPEQIDLSRVRAAGVTDLKHYLEFAIGGPAALLSQSAPTGRGADSPFEQAVATMLRDKGWVVHPQVGCSGYRIDMAVVDPRAPGRYLLGIECDGASYHSAASARDRDRLRQHVLAQLGWTLHRIWSTDWWFDAQRELEKLHARLEALAAQELPPAEPDPATATGLGLAGVAQPAPPQAVAPAGTDAAVAPSERDSSSGSHLASAPPAAAGPAVPPPADPQADPRAEPRAEPQGARPGASLPRYAPAVVPGGQTELFHDAGAAPALRQNIQAIVTQEGPVLDAVLFRRVARAWGLERTGSRIVERLRAVVPAELIRTREGDKTFYWPAGATPERWTGFRVAGPDEASRRHIGEVPLEEIAALLRHVLAESGATTRQDLARTTCRLLGMSRMPAEAEARVQAAIELLLARAAIRQEGDYLLALS